MKSRKIGCCTLPMRNWHKYPTKNISSFQEHAGSCTLPMRNWHLIRYFSAPYSVVSKLYLTYEELTHVPFWFVEIIINFFMLYLTYEELTHYFKFICHDFSFLVVPYLWGIDTFTFNEFITKILNIVVPYLWGIDTFHHQIKL